MPTSNGENDSRTPAGVARAFAGAMLFALPLCINDTMWRIGATTNRLRLLFLMVAFLPILVGLSDVFGFRRSRTLFQDMIDTAIAVFAAACSVSVLLLLFGAITSGMSGNEVLGKIGVQLFPASFGALIAQAVMKTQPSDYRRNASHAGSSKEIIVMAGGALFLAFQIAYHADLRLIAERMTNLQMILVLVLGVVLVHAVVYTSRFRDEQKQLRQSVPVAVVRVSFAGFSVAFALSCLLLWTYGQLDGLWAGDVLRLTTIVAFPAALGAGAARLIL